jgi:hypothetical protein
VLAALVATNLFGCNVLFGGGPEPEPEPEEDAGEPEPERDAGPPPQPDEVPPSIVIVTPAEDCLDGVVRFGLEVADEGSGVGIVQARFAGNDLDLVDDGDGAFHADFDTSALFTGFHVLTVTAIDTSNNLADEERSYGHINDVDDYISAGGISCGTPPDAGPPDTTEPVVTITTPAGTAYAGDSLAVGATVTDESALTVTATLGTASVELTGFDGIYSGELDTSAVTEGVAPLVITAVDAADNSGADSKVVTVDHTPPSITISVPAANEERLALHDTTAIASDDVAMERVLLFEVGTADALGVAIGPDPNTTDAWSIPYRLPCAGLPRDTTFEMRARDRAGNSASATVPLRVLPDGCGS